MTMLVAVLVLVVLNVVGPVPAEPKVKTGFTVKFTRTLDGAPVSHYVTNFYGIGGNLRVELGLGRLKACVVPLGRLGDVVSELCTYQGVTAIHIE